MAKPRSSPIRSVLRFCWRFARTGAVCLALIVASFFIHLHNVGLPDFVKSRLLAGLAERGWQMDFSRLRFRWMQGIVGEDLHLRPVEGRAGPQLFVERIDFRLNRQELLRLAFSPESLDLRHGRCIWVLAQTNSLRQNLILEQVDGNLRYSESDRLDLSAFTARFHGLDLRIEGHLTNITHLREIRWPKPKQKTPSGVSTEEALQEVAHIIDQCEIGSGASLTLKLQGDLQKAHSFQAELDFKLPAVRSPWLTGTNVEFWSKVFPPAVSSLPFELRWRLSGQGCLTPWGDARDLRMEGKLEQRVDEPLPHSGSLSLLSSQLTTPRLNLDGLETLIDFSRVPELTNRYRVSLNGSNHAARWDGGTVDGPRFEGRFLLDADAWTPTLGDLDLGAGRVETRGVTLRTPRARIEFTNPATNRFWVRPEATNGPSTWALQRPILPALAPVEFRWHVLLAELEVPALRSQDVEMTGRWRFPEAAVSQLRGRLNRGDLSAQVNLNVSNRLVTATLTNTTDVHLLGPILGTNAMRWLSQYGWKQPPWVRGEASLVLPEWSHFLNRLTRDSRSGLPAIPWREESIPTLRVAGSMRVGEGDFRKAQFSSATMNFYCTNQVWWLPNIVALRPEGRLELEHISDEVSRDYSFKIRSEIDPQAIKPIIAPSAHDDLDLFRFERPPLVEGIVSGRWRVPERLAVQASVRATNLSFRGESARAFAVKSLSYTNRLFLARELSMEREEGRATVGEAWFHLDDLKLRLTNVVSGVHLAPVCRAIGPKVAETMREYDFQSPPKVLMNGVVDTLKKRNENDLHFAVDAANFHWKLFQLPQLVAQVDWVKDRLDLEQVMGLFYGGKIRGGAHFDFSQERGTDFRFDLNASGVFLSQLMKDISSRSNRVEGVLDCQVVVTNANTRDKFTWNGYGQGELTNGLIWDIPVFALISPALNAFSPGLGNSRARQAVGTFSISNGVIYTHDLEIRANAMRLKSNGSVDFEKRLNAKMEAELLRDMPGIGFVLSKLFWPVTKLFEFKITGTLDQPRTDQLYMIPRILMAPLHPIRTLKDLFQADSKDAKKGSERGTEPARPEGKP